METNKPKQQHEPVAAADRALGERPSSPNSQPLATLPDGVPSVLWEEAVESERYFDDAPATTR
jgi:hypothetical protein